MRGAVEKHAPLVEAEDAIEAREHVKIVGDHDDLLLQRRYLTDNAAAVARVKQGGWLVGDDELRFDHEHGGQREQLLFAPGEGVR